MRPLLLLPLLCSGCFAFLQPGASGAGVFPGTLETVPFTEAPAPPGGPGWFCYQMRVVTYRGSHPEAKESSGCFRTLQECRTTTEQKRVGAAANHEEATIGTCARQPQASCMYVWSNATTGNHLCYAAPDDCEPFMFSGGVTKQSECGLAN